MPTIYVIDKEAGILYRTLTGVVTTDELLESFDEALRDPDYRPGMHMLTDMRGVTTTAHKADVARVAAYVKSHVEEIGPLKVAVVAPTDASFGLIRMLQAHLGDVSIELSVFREMREAEDWLGVEQKAASGTGD
jgi:hypothetical protein